MSDYKQTRDAAGSVTSQYGQMLRNIDESLSAADIIKELEEQRNFTQGQVLRLDSKRAKAKWLLTEAQVQLREGKAKTRRNRADLIEAFLEEENAEV